MDVIEGKGMTDIDIIEQFTPDEQLAHERVMQRLTSRDDGNDWQYIETAPKDGTDILLYGYLTGEVETHKPPVKIVSKAHWNGSQWQVSDTCGYRFWIISAAYWMPLPKPPGGHS
jgi:hypothetical protein